MKLKSCSCGLRMWKWQIDDRLLSWIRCSNCGDSAFSDDIGVIMINWQTTVGDFNLNDVLVANQKGRVVANQKGRVVTPAEGNLSKENKNDTH